ncbi:Lactamase-B domain-containing protein [Mycena sanguinolenta]|uniref:Lactamase-B domain-containing protein n=1 Tax=Mycena sanguinolenta TaxID=230812 RepID=A0A8H6X351_9AGAR|nr:Lactamase-B domain-containing protein [Mycena sanguinolenta]
MSESTPSLPAPSANQPYVHISALQAGIIHLPVDLIIQGEPRVYRPCPSLSFYLAHSASERHNFIFDLGLRKNRDSYPPAALEHFGTLMPWEVPQSVEESCVKGGVKPEEVERVMLSHLHFDHIGDHTPFTKATFVLGGRGKVWLDDGYPGNPNSRVLSESTPMDRTVFLNPEDFNTSIGPFPHAMDFFGDGSVYVIDTPGHCPGHINLLVRTSADGSWMYLGGDIAHDTRLLTDPTTHIGHHAESGTPYCMHTDAAQAEIDIGRVRELVKMPRVEFLIAHDWEWYERNFERAFLPNRIVPGK